MVCWPTAATAPHTSGCQSPPWRRHYTLATMGLAVWPCTHIVLRSLHLLPAKRTRIHVANTAATTAQHQTSHRNRNTPTDATWVWLACLVRLHERATPQRVPVAQRSSYIRHRRTFFSQRDRCLAGAFWHPEEAVDIHRHLLPPPRPRMPATSLQTDCV